MREYNTLQNFSGTKSRRIIMSQLFDINKWKIPFARDYFELLCNSV